MQITFTSQQSFTSEKIGRHLELSGTFIVAKEAYIRDGNTFRNNFQRCLSSGAVSTTSSGPEMRMEGNSFHRDTQLRCDPGTSDHTHFDNVDIDGGSVKRTFTIRNTGWDTLMLSGTPYVTVNPAAFTVTFDPDAVGSTSVTVSIDNTAANNFT